MKNTEKQKRIEAGTEGQDRDNYTDDQDRESYTVSNEEEEIPQHTGGIKPPKIPRKSITP